MRLSRNRKVRASRRAAAPRRCYLSATTGSKSASACAVTAPTLSASIRGPFGDTVHDSSHSSYRISNIGGRGPVRGPVAELECSGRKRGVTVRPLVVVSLFIGDGTFFRDRTGGGRDCIHGNGIEARQLCGGCLGGAVTRAAERGAARRIQAEEARWRDNVLHYRCDARHAFRHREMLQRARHGEGGPAAAGPAQSTPSARPLRRREL